jgi:outer membrane protein OmpA-like peptidoglycan-associated protein
MKDNPETRWRVEGHTDASGSEEYNMTLAKARAEAIVTYLVSKGIDRNRLDVVPMGETQPVGDNKTSEGRAMNRRVEIKLIEDGSEKNQQDQKHPQDQDNRQE